MKAHSLRLLALSSFGLLGACAAEGPSGPLTVAVAPLTLPGIADVCYGLTVFNGDPAGSPDTVWALEHICSGQYGNGTGGDITYIGTCDADSGEHNYVQLILETIEDTNNNILLDQNTVTPGGDSDFINPCADEGQCVLDFACVENEDVLVEFNISVMRDAEQGFFDIAVNFEDVFCSAKADSCYDANSHITLLYGDDDNDTLGRDHTFVAGFACTAGPDYVNSQDDIIDVETQLILTAPRVSCVDRATGSTVDFTIPLTGPAVDGGNGTVTNGTFELFYGVYFDAEDLSCGSVVSDEPAEGPVAGSIAYGKEGEYYATWENIGPGQWTLWGDTNGDDSDENLTAEFGKEDAQVKFTYNGNSVSPFFETTDLSCNKAFYNFAIDIENLGGQGLSNCRLNYAATAQDANSPIFDVLGGSFLDAQAVYGAVRYAGVPLTDANANPVCDAHPLDGETFDGDESNVTSVYVFGDAYSTRDGQGKPQPRYYSNGGPAQDIGDN